MASTPTRVWWEDEENLILLQLENMSPQMVWSQHNWTYWSQGGKATELQLQDWQMKGIYGAYFPDNVLWQHEWNWLMSLPVGKLTLEFTHLKGVPWTSPLVLENSNSPPQPSSKSPERPRDEQLEGEERKSVVGLAIEGSTPQSGQLRAVEQTSSPANGAEGPNSLATVPIMRSSALSDPILPVYSQCSLEKDVGSHFKPCAYHLRLAKRHLMEWSSLSEPDPEVCSQRSFRKDATSHFIYCACTRVNRQSTRKRTNGWWSFAGTGSILADAEKKRAQCWNSEK